MKQVSTISFCLIISLLITSQGLVAPYQETHKFSAKNPLIIFDFNNKDSLNKVGDAFGIFDANPDDQEAFIKMQYKKDTELHKKGYHLKVTYDVESSQDAFNGIWTKLKTLDLSKFEAVSLSVRGDKRKGFSKLFKIEIKDHSKKIETIVDGITDKWKKVVIPFDDFDGPVDEIQFKKIKEFVIIFEDWRVTKKVGRYYIDDISFIPKKGVAVKYKDIVK